MNADCIPFDQIPHSSKLFLDYISHAPGTAPFYTPHTVSAVADYARTLRFDDTRRQAIADVLERQNREWEASEATFRSIARLRAGAVAVLSGQQVGLFGGPLYSVLKAASAVQLASELSAQGIDAVPIFWLATEDHDLAEVNQVYLPDGDGHFRPFNSAVQAKPGIPVGEVKFGSEIEELTAQAARALSPEMADTLRASYRAGETFGSAFGRLFSRLFANTGLVLLQPLDREVHAIAAPLLLAAAESARELDEELLRRGERLRAQGYHEQVKVTASSTLLFVLQNGERTVMHTAGDDFLVGAERLPRAAVLERLRLRPEEFSPNVLLRPVVQDYLLPTVTYFGGPAEIAYFAQAGVVYQRLLGRVTPVLPRLSLTVVNSRMQRLLNRHQLRLPELFNGEIQLRERIAAGMLPAALRGQLDQGRQTVRDLIAGLGESLGRLDPTLAKAVEKAGRKMAHQVERLAGKAARAELRRQEQLTREASELMNGLFPAGGLQERSVPGIFALSAGGSELLERFIESASVHCPGHQLLFA